MEVSEPQYKMLSSSSEFLLFGGAASGGKSWALCLDPLRHVQGKHATPDARCALFRKTHPQLMQAGGLFDTTTKIYTPLGAKFNHTRSEWTFPSGAKIGLNTLQHEKDIEQYLGAQWDWVGIDESAAFSLQNVMFFWSRCRSKSGIKPNLRLTANPDNSSFLYPLIHWWLDSETGYPNYDKAGVIRHFVTQDDTFIWSDDPVFDDKGVKISTSMTFIPAKITDNSHLMKSDPSYYRRLMSLPTQERERFLEGSWLASSNTGTEWPRECFTDLFIPIERFPTPKHANDIVRMFAVDASKGKSEKKGDYSALVCLAQTSELAYVDADLKRRPPGQIVEDLFLFCEQDHHRIRSGDLIGVESTQFQSIFRDLIVTYAESHREYALSKYIASGGLIIPIEDHMNKQMRIRRLDQRIRQREMRYLENPGTTLLLNQLKQFDGIPGVGKHDDGPDALAMCTQLPRYEQEYWENLRKEK